jgi:hypothetical protein
MGGATEGKQAPRAQGLLAYVTAAALLVAGVAAIVAIAGGRLGVEDLQVLGTSLGFAIFSATSAAGAALWRDRTTATAWVGGATVVLSAMSLVVLVMSIWNLDADGGRTFGSLALLTLAGSHASIVLRAGRASDGDTIRLLSAASILLASLDCGAGALLVQGTVPLHHVEQYARAAAVVVIAMLVTTALPPLLRSAAKRGATRAALPPPPPAPPPPSPAPAPAVTTSPTRKRRGGWQLRTLFKPAGTVALATVVAVAAFLFGQATVETPHPVYTNYAPPATYVPPAATPAPASPAPVPAGGPQDAKLRLDAVAQAEARDAASLTEKCASSKPRHRHTSCTTAEQLGPSHVDIVTSAPGAGQVNVVATSGGMGFVVTAQSQSGNTFSIVKDATGAYGRSCTGTDGGCANGSW